MKIKNWTKPTLKDKNTEMNPAYSAVCGCKEGYTCTDYVPCDHQGIAW